MPPTHRDPQFLGFRVMDLAGGALGGGLRPDGRGYQPLVDVDDVKLSSSQHAGDAMTAQTKSKPGAAETDDPKERESALCRLELGDYAIEDVARFDRSTMLELDTEHAKPRTLQGSRTGEKNRVSALVYSPDNMTLVSATGDKILLHPTVRARARDGILPPRTFALATCSHVRRPNIRMQVDPRPERPGASMKSSVETTDEASSGGSSGNSITCTWEAPTNNKDSSKVLSLSFAAETSVFAAGCSDGYWRLFDTKTLKPPEPDDKGVSEFKVTERQVNKALDKDKGGVSAVAFPTLSIPSEVDISLGGAGTLAANQERKRRRCYFASGPNRDSEVSVVNLSEAVMDEYIALQHGFGVQMGMTSVKNSLIAAVGSWEANVRLVDAGAHVNAGEELALFSQPHTKKTIVSTSISPQGDMMASTCNDGSVVVRKLSGDDGKYVRYTGDGGAHVNTLSFPTGTVHNTLLAVGTRNLHGPSQVFLLDVMKGKRIEIQQYKVHECASTVALTWTPDASKLIVCTDGPEPRVNVYDVNELLHPSPPPVKKAPAAAPAAAPAEAPAAEAEAVGTGDTESASVPVEAGPQWPPDDYPHVLYSFEYVAGVGKHISLAVSPDSKILAIGGDGVKSLELHDLSKPVKLEHALPGPSPDESEVLHAVCFRPPSSSKGTLARSGFGFGSAATSVMNQILACARGEIVQLYKVSRDPSTETKVSLTMEHGSKVKCPGRVVAIDISTTGFLAVSHNATDRKGVRVFDIDGPKADGGLAELAFERFEWSNAQLTSALRFSPDGKHLASLSGGMTLTPIREPEDEMSLGKKFGSALLATSVAEGARRSSVAQSPMERPPFTRQQSTSALSTGLSEEQAADQREERPLKPMPTDVYVDKSVCVESFAFSSDGGMLAVVPMMRNVADRTIVATEECVIGCPTLDTSKEETWPSKIFYEVHLEKLPNPSGSSQKQASFEISIGFAKERDFLDALRERGGLDETTKDGPLCWSVRARAGQPAQVHVPPAPPKDAKMNIWMDGDYIGIAFDLKTGELHVARCPCTRYLTPRQRV